MFPGNPSWQVLLPNVQQSLQERLQGIQKPNRPSCWRTWKHAGIKKQTKKKKRIIQSDKCGTLSFSCFVLQSGAKVSHTSGAGPPVTSGYWCWAWRQSRIVYLHIFFFLYVVVLKIDPFSSVGRSKKNCKREQKNKKTKKSPNRPVVVPIRSAGVLSSWRQMEGWVSGSGRDQK